MKQKVLFVFILFFITSSYSNAITRIKDDFNNISDTLSIIMQQRTTVKVKLELKSVMKRGNFLDFYFTESLGDIPWKKDDAVLFKNSLRARFPKTYKKYKLGDIYSNGQELTQLITPVLYNDGHPHKSSYRTNDHNNKTTPIVEEIGNLKFNKGLSGRHIALWQSHGRYFNKSKDKWEWQRAQFFRTVEDMYTQSFVLPFLIPMLENAGAYVMTPRERDTQPLEIIVDNDPAFVEERTGLIRGTGKYIEEGKWMNAGVGFADKQLYYKYLDNPFTMGTARMTKCTNKERQKSEITWIPLVQKRGRYAVYVSYKSLPNSTKSAHYTVRHMGGTTEFFVNQKMGGSTWIYLGTFEFDRGEKGCVTLDNLQKKGRKYIHGSIVTADGIKIGGGMGKIARGRSDEPDSTLRTSGLPSYLEGALYQMQWSGIDSTVTAKFNDDYTNDFAGRGAWTATMTGGSRVNPKQPGKGIPIDMSLAFHSDAGITPNDSTIGTLAIYTSKCSGQTKFPDGEDRMASREYSDLVQTQVVNDIRKQFEQKWTRRQLWDRSYSESRTTSVPALLLEILAHQNFADMKYGLDPSFRFTVSRAVYKGMLKFLSNRYGCNYEVQPLPVNSFSAILQTDSTVRLSWKATVDTLESTALSKGFILYRRIDDGAFDTGTIIKDYRYKNGIYSIDMPLERGHLYSYKVVAYNDGGKSFPSETLCAGIPINDEINKSILIINNFYRVSAPAWFDTPEYAGFDASLDSGVPFYSDISFCGNMYQFRRQAEWKSSENPGFGASYGNYIGRQIAGNTFDYPRIHAKALMAEGYACSSASSAALNYLTLDSNNTFAIDIICGKQVRESHNTTNKKNIYEVFPDYLRKSIKSYTDIGGNVLISGANIGTDVWDNIYPIVSDNVYPQKCKQFIKNVFCYNWITGYASPTPIVLGSLNTVSSIPTIKGKLSFYNIPNEESYCTETPDGIAPATKDANTFLIYESSGISAGVSYNSGHHKAVSIGFPIETIKSSDDIQNLMKAVMTFFKQ